MMGSALKLVKSETYEDLVAAGREVLRERDDTNWKAGDLALQVETLKGARTDLKNGSKTPLQEYAEDIGVKESSLRSWRSVAEAYPPRYRGDEVSWAVHRTLVAQPDRFELVKNQPTLKEAKQIVRDRDQPEGKPDVLPSTFGDRLVHALGQMEGNTTAFENLCRSNDGRQFRARHVKSCARYAVIVKAQAELLERIGNGEFPSINYAAFHDILIAPWQNELDEEHGELKW